MSQVHPADIGRHAIRALLSRSGLNPHAVEDVVFGNLTIIERLERYHTGQQAPVVTMATIRRADETDISRIARTASLAFADDPVLRWLFPDDDHYEATHQAVFGSIARRWMATESLWCTDDAVAIAGWVPPGRPDAEVTSTAPRVDHPPWRLERLKALGEKMAANTPSELHWYLNMLATHPDWQRQGLGTALMAVVFEIADDVGLPCYLETETIELVGYYRHHGFDIRSEWDIRTGDSDGPHMWGMLRQPYAGR